MQIFRIKRKTKTINLFSPKMGRLVAKVTYIKKYFLFVPVRTIHKYRETYYGEVKMYYDCHLYI